MDSQRQRRQGHHQGPGAVARPPQGDRLSGYLYYSYLDATLEDGIPVPKVAEHKISAGLTYRHDALSLSPRLRWTSDIKKIPNPGFDESDQIDGHLVVDFTARLRQLFGRVDLYLAAVNLLDEDYFAASPYGEGRDGWIMDKNPQPGRSLSVGLVWGF